MTTTSGRARLVLVAALAGTLVAGAAGTAPALGAPAATPAKDPRPGLLRAFAAAPAGGSTTTPLGAERARPAAGAGKTPRVIGSGDRGAAPTTATRRSTAAAPGDCASLNASVVQTLDRTHVVWDTVPGATSFSVSRQRYGGSALTLRSGLPAETTSFLDSGHNPLGSAAWYVNATVGGATISCRTPESGWWTMSSPDGTGWPDVFFAGDTAMYEQDTFGPAFSAWKGSLSRPSFSPTGRQVVAVEDVGGTSSITYRVAETGKLLWSVASPSGLVLDEPAVSPDGQKVVVEAVDANDASVSRGLYSIAVWSNHTPRLVPGSVGLATPDWLDTPGATSSTQIVAADLSVGGGLVLVNASTGGRTVVTGTAGAIDPTGLPDGSVLFATNTAGGATVEIRSATGAISPVGDFPDSEIRWPVTAPDGSAYFFIRYPDESNPGSYLWSVDQLDDSGVGTPTWIGGTWEGSSPGFRGFDLRTPFSAGTSDLGGSANGDILARDSAGRLWAYPVSASGDQFLDRRGYVGGGWNTMRQFIAAGDLNGDGRGDVLAVDSSGVLWSYPGRGGFKFGARTRIGGGWGSYALASTGDLNGDSLADIVARDPSGVLWRYPSNGRGGLGSRSRIGGGWNIMNAIVGPGDWNYDGLPDLLARERSTGTLWLYPGNGRGTLGTRRSLGKGWNARTAFATPEIYWGLTAMFARTTDGLLLDYDSVGNGVVNGNNVYVVSKGWNPYTVTG